MLGKLFSARKRTFEEWLAEARTYREGAMKLRFNGYPFKAEQQDREASMCEANAIGLAARGF